MKRRKPWDGPTKRSIAAFTYERKGSILLEAALVMPLLLFLLAAFSVIISLCMAQMALHATASQSARQIAAHMYPVELAQQQLQAAAGAAVTPNLPVPLPGWSEVAADAAEWLPDPAGEFVSSALRGDWRPLQNLAATELGRGVIEPFVRQYANDYVLKPERIRLSYISLPDLKDKEEPYIAIALEYEYPFRIPFLGRPIVLREQAYERVWVSDAAPAAYGSEAESGENTLQLQIVSISPNPLRPGQKATVVVKTEPGARVSLSVTYKSGASKAKHLGEAAADDQGYVQWTWHVSGNTTPGIWELEVEGSGRKGSVSKHFVVEKKPDVRSGEE
ncbi:TadE/TadG family type IV pilus assembly protein [Paenibacillus soyae]|uniref:Pilus assembly protein n=1 Tax=Paenibacillus soyae TaxID=2969249 RepID=A0A9X2MLK9_9BACL|nr:TadE/TadG family type IV pilus assembly protein [Paenibacillus soyae]MCR2802349.1 pilus assembly protein [Paenibacillus soyae]